MRGFSSRFVIPNGVGEVGNPFCLDISIEERFLTPLEMIGKRLCLRTSTAIISVFFWLVALLPAAMAQDSPLDTAKHAYEKGDYKKAIEILKPAADSDPGDGELQLLLTKCYLETKQWDAAVSSGEKAVASNPKSSAYHEWLGDAYGQKADHASKLSAYSLARKTQKEFETAVQLDERNFDAMQNLIEYDCTAPSVVGGGEDKARPLIQKLMGMDAAQGYYAQGNCLIQKKDFVGADAQFAKALENKPKTADQIYGMAAYFANRGQGDKVLEAAAAGEDVSATDPRVMFFRAVGWIVKGEKPSEAEKNLQEYLRLAPGRSDYPRPWSAHYWLGKLYESQKNIAGARSEYQAALKLNGKYKKAQEALKRLGN